MSCRLFSSLQTVTVWGLISAHFEEVRAVDTGTMKS